MLRGGCGRTWGLGYVQHMCDDIGNGRGIGGGFGAGCMR